MTNQVLIIENGNLTCLIMTPLLLTILWFQQHGSTGLPSPSTLYCECAFALLNADRYDDTITICNQVLAMPGVAQGEGIKVAMLSRMEAKGVAIKDV